MFSDENIKGFDRSVGNPDKHDKSINQGTENDKIYGFNDQ